MTQNKSAGKTLAKIDSKSRGWSASDEGESLNFGVGFEEEEVKKELNRSGKRRKNK